MATITYKVETAIEIPSRPWQLLPGANPHFFDSSKQLSGLNKNAANYDETETGGDWGVYIRLVALMSTSKTDPVTTEYQIYSGKGRVLDHNELNSVTSPWSVVISILDSNGVDIGANLKYNDTMTFKAVFTLATGLASAYPSAWAELRMQKNNGSSNDLMSYSSLRTNKSGMALYDATGKTVVQSGVPATNKFTATCKIDGSKLIKGQRYLFAAHLDFP